MSMIFKDPEMPVAIGLPAATRAFQKAVRTLIKESQKKRFPGSISVMRSDLIRIKTPINYKCDITQRAMKRIYRPTINLGLNVSYDWTHYLLRECRQ